MTTSVRVPPFSVTSSPTFDKEKVEHEVLSVKTADDSSGSERTDGKRSYLDLFPRIPTQQTPKSIGITDGVFAHEQKQNKKVNQKTTHINMEG